MPFGIRQAVGQSLLAAVFGALAALTLAACGSETASQDRQGELTDRTVEPTPALQPTATHSATPEPTATASSTPELMAQSESLLDDLPWVKDGIHPTEERSLARLRLLEERHPHLAQAVAALPWIADGLSVSDREFISDISSAAKTALEAAVATVTVPDGTEQLTIDTLDALQRVSLYKRSQWKRLKDSP